MSNLLPDQLRALLERRLPNTCVNVLCTEDLNSAEVVASGRILALIEIPQTRHEHWDPIVSARMAVDEHGHLRAIFLHTRSEVDAARKEKSSEAQSSEKDGDEGS